jgi:hypothetical protein
MMFDHFQSKFCDMWAGLTLMDYSGDGICGAGVILEGLMIRTRDNQDRKPAYLSLICLL